MTGYGKAIETINQKKFTVEVRSVNSKQLDLNVKLPSLYREKEIELRNAVSEKMGRGKAEISLQCESNGEEKLTKIDVELAKRYYEDIELLSNEIGKSDESVLSILMRMPDVLKAEKTELDEEEWNAIMQLTLKAVDAFDEFRNQEGAALEKDLKTRVASILSLLKQVEPFEEERLTTVKERIQKKLSEHLSKDDVDNNRFEQELIYYLEKFDITEEKVRLKAHCDYFLETLNSSAGQGKKLGFIGQEMGREINTLGSKANHSEMQKVVVQMKDELEKIKEQILNVL